MSSQTVSYLVIGVVVLGLLVYRQLVARPVGQNQRILLILLVIGAVETAQYLGRGHVGAAAMVALLGSLVLAAVFGAARAATVRIWLQDGRAWSKGNLVTALLWVAALGAHLGYDYLVGLHKDIGSLGNATIVLYLAVSLAVQRVIVGIRAQRLGPAASGPIGGAGASPF